MVAEYSFENIRTYLPHNTRHFPEDHSLNIDLCEEFEYYTKLLKPATLYRFQNHYMLKFHTLLLIIS